MKKIILLISLAGILLVLNSCTATGSVATEPGYVEYARPARPSDMHIWIDGDWLWNGQNNRYVQGKGSWQRPVRGRHYVKGNWEVTSKGHRWNPGSWQR